MSDVLELRGLDEIESRRLAWEKLWGESRWQHFSMRWDWFRLLIRWNAAQWEPMVLEARWGDRVLGMLPLLAHRKIERWASPNLVTGVGPATLLGREVTAAWMQIANYLKRKRSRSGTLDLGPFDPSWGVGSRLETAFQNIAHRRLAKLKVTRREIDTTLRIWDSQSSTARAWEVVSTCGQSRHDHGLSAREWDQLSATIASGDTKVVSPIGCLTEHPNAALDAVETLASAGLLWMTQTRERGGARQLLWVGDREQLEPLMELRPAGAAGLDEADVRGMMQSLHHAGIKRVSVGGWNWPKLAEETQQAYRTYGFAPKLDVRSTWHVLWNPLKVATPVLR